MCADGKKTCPHGHVHVSYFTSMAAGAVMSTNTVLLFCSILSVPVVMMSLMRLATNRFPLLKASTLM